MASTKVVVFDVIYNSAVEGSGECTKRSTNISPRARQWRASGAVGPWAWWRGLGRGGGRGGGPRVARRRGTGARSGGRTRKKRAAPVSRKANGRGGGGARKKRVAVFDEEEDERIDLRQALEVIYQRELLPVPATNRE